MIKTTKLANWASDRLGRWLGWIPLHPNTITLASVFIAFFAFLAYDGSFEGKISSFILFIFAFLFDVVDGAIARAKRLVTKEGAFIDGVADRVVEFFLILTLFRVFAFLPDVQLALIAILFFGTCMTVFVKAYAEHQGVLDHERAAKLPGILERAERSILLLIAFALLIFGQADYGVCALYAAAILSFITFAQRFSGALYAKN